MRALKCENIWKKWSDAFYWEMFICMIKTMSHANEMELSAACIENLNALMYICSTYKI